MSKTIKKLMLLAPVALLLGMFAPAGCDGGSSCVSSCEDGKSCDTPVYPEDTDCQELCDNARQAAVDAGCETEYDDSDKACSGGNVCDPADITEDCAEKAASYATCLLGAATP